MFSLHKYSGNLGCYTFTSRIQEDLTNKRKSFSSRSLFSKYKAMARNVIHVRIHARNFSLNFVLGSQLCYRSYCSEILGSFATSTNILWWFYIAQNNFPEQGRKFEIRDDCFPRFNVEIHYSWLKRNLRFVFHDKNFCLSYLDRTVIKNHSWCDKWYVFPPFFSCKSHTVPVSLFFYNPIVLSVWIILLCVNPMLSYVDPIMLFVQVLQFSCLSSRDTYYRFVPF